MIISKRFITKPRKIRSCDFCHAPIIKDCVRLFGRAMERDPVAQLFYHERCDKLQAAGYTADDLNESNPYTQYERNAA